MLVAFSPNKNTQSAQLWLSAFTAAMPEHQFKLLSQLNECEKQQVTVAIVANAENIDFAQLPELKWIQCTWTGVENLLDNPSLTAIPIVRMQDPELANTMASTVFCWVMNCQRHIPWYSQQQLRQHWQSHPVKSNKDTRVLLLGAGNLGMTSARLLVAQGYQVAVWCRTPRSNPIDEIAFYQGRDGLKSALPLADIVVALLPHTPATTSLLDEQVLSWLRPDSYLLNFGRGSVIKASALLERLDQNGLRHAVLDVFEEEPLPFQHAFWHHPKITVLPHIAAPTNPETASLIIKKNLSDYLLKGKIPESVDVKRGY